MRDTRGTASELSMFNVDGDTFIAKAIRGDHVNMVKAMIEKGWLIDVACTSKGETPFELAKSCGSTKVCAYMQANYDLIQATVNGDAEAMEKAIQNGASVNMLFSDAFAEQLGEQMDRATAAKLA